ncbi:MAG: GNAT family N-acetyltransferase, partial [Betaproteobacteria bacterium HGW-Betaproteobacteria-21]
MRSPDSLSEIDKARLADFSEARAYSALVECAREVNDPTFRTARIGSALALCSDTVKSSVIFNRVIGLGLFEDATEQMLDEAADLYAKSRVPWGVEVSAVTRPEMVVEWLKKRRMR